MLAPGERANSRPNRTGARKLFGRGATLYINSPGGASTALLGIYDTIIEIPEKISRDTDRDFILTAEQAQNYGVIDEVISSRTLAHLSEFRPARGPEANGQGEP
jgi:hypothetical protein